VNKIKAVREEADRLGIFVKISVDGGINDKTAADVFKAGADIAVVGTYLLNSDDYVGAVLSIRIAAQ
jgi:pentose-5-phosphate-3-epimerase